MSISQLFILSRRGDSIIYRDFRRDIKKSNDIFFRNVNFYTEEEIAPPLFNVDGINFIYVKTEDLYIAISTLDNASPNYYLEVLDRLMKVIKDHIGDLTEETIRKNFVLIYEIIDEMIDFGYPQLSDTEQVKQFVFTEPVVELKNINTIKEIFNKNTKSNESAKKSITVTNDAKSKNEIFVDIIEKVTCLFSRNGTILSSGIDGCIKMKSYLKNSPELRIVLSDEIIIGKTSYSAGRMELAGYNFCQGVRTKDFESQRTLYIVPPEGEFILMNYRINNEFAPPFRLYTIVEESDYKLELRIKLMANFSSTTKAGNIKISFNAPKETQSVYFNLPKQFKETHKVDYNQNEHICTWKIPTIMGGSENTLDVKFTLQVNKPNLFRKELGPIAMAFEIPNFNISHMQIKELKVMANDAKYNAMRWVRMFTKAKSYVTRIA
jgi:AP-4 complex subunit mu-1